MSLDDMIFDVYCYLDHMDFMTVEEVQVSSIFNEELDLQEGGENYGCICSNNKRIGRQYQ